MDRDQFTIASATGVDVSLEIAGPGSRSYAFIVDWHIRVLLALAWFAAAALLALGHVLPKADDDLENVGFVFGTVLPPTFIYFFYHPILEVAMRGRTPGKRLAGVRVVTASGGVPSVGAILIRNIFRLIDSLPVLYLVGLVCTIATEKRVRIGDLAGGTVLAFDRGADVNALADFSLRAARTRLPAAALDVTLELLDRWQALDRAHRVDLAHAIVKRFGDEQMRAGLGSMGEDALHAALKSLAGGPAAP